jgi:Phage major capsid protein E
MMNGQVYQFPTNVALDRLTQEYAVQREKLLGIQILPFQDEWVQIVQWDELDNESGITAPHALGADVKISQRPGSKLRQYTPAHFKEGELIKEDEMLMARQYATLGNVINLDDAVGRRLRARIDKDFLRAEQLAWGALGGSINVNENGVKVAETFPVQTYPIMTLWSNRSDSTPLKDFNGASLLFRGTGATGKGAKAYMNQTTANALLENTNDDDIHGFRSQNFLSLTFTVEEANKVLEGRGLPTIEVYDEGYYVSKDDFRTFLADGEVRIVGKRPAGQKVGDTALTPSLHRIVQGRQAPGFFSIIECNGQPSMGTFSAASLGASSNPKIQITTGWYGGPRLYYPRSVIKMQVL